MRELSTSPGIKFGVTASAVLKAPYAAQGCLPTSAVNQPVKVARNGNGKPKKIAHSKSLVRSSAFLKARSDPSHATANMASPQPTITRKAKNGMSTGGLSAFAKEVNPTSFEFKVIVAIRLPRTGTFN